MSPMYPRDKHACLFRAGAPLDHHIRGGWHRDITIRGGTVITHDEEGVNNMPLDIEKTNRGKIVHLDMERINLVKKKCSIEAMNNVKHQIAWSKLHRANICHHLESLESRAIAAIGLTYAVRQI